MVPKNQELAILYDPVEGESIEGIVEGVYEGIFRPFLKITDEDGQLWSIKQCTSVVKQIEALNLEKGDVVKITYKGQGEDYLTAHEYLVEKFEDNQWKSVNTKTLIEYLFNPEKGESIEGEVLDVYIGDYEKYVLKIKSPEDKVYLTKQCYSTHKQIQQLTLEKGDYVKVTYLGRADDEWQTHRYFIELKTDDGFKSVNDLIGEDKENFFKPVKGDILEGKVVSVKKGQFGKLYLKIKDTEDMVWITNQCKTLDYQIKNLHIKSGDEVKLEYKGQRGEFNTHIYVLRKIKEDNNQ